MMNKQTQRTCILVFILIAMLTIGTLASADIVHRFDDDGTTFMYAMNDEFAWMVTDDRVSVRDLVDAEKVVHDCAIQPADHIYADARGLYIYRETSGSASIELYDVSGNSISQWKLPNDVFVQQFVVVEDDVFAVALDHIPVDEAVDISSDTMLYKYSLVDGTGYFCKSEPIRAITAGEHDSILCLYSDEEDGNFVGVWSVSSDEMKEVYSLPGMEFSAIVKAENGCYLLSDLGIHNLDFTMGATTLVYTMRQGYEHWAGLQRTNSFVATEDFASGELILFEIKAVHERNTLVLVNVSKFNDVRINAAVEMFQKMNPEVDVSFIEVDNTKLSTALMANEAGYDILLVDDYSIDVYRESGVLEDLSNYTGIWQGIEEAWNEMPLLNGEYRDSVYLYVLPVVFSTNEEAPRITNVEFRQQELSWEEFYATVADLYENYGVAPIGGSIRFPVFFTQYLAWCMKENTVDFDTDIFREGMIHYKDAYNNGIVVNRNESDFVLTDGKLGVYPLETTVLLPMINGERIYPCSTYSLVVSRTSKQKELAAEFLDCFVSLEIQRTADVNTMAAGFLQDASLYPCSDVDIGYPSEAQVELNAELLKYAIRVPYNKDFNIFAGDQIEAFIQGDIAIDEMVSSLNEKYQMIEMG